MTTKRKPGAQPDWEEPTKQANFRVGESFRDLFRIEANALLDKYRDAIKSKGLESAFTFMRESIEKNNHK